MAPCPIGLSARAAGIMIPCGAPALMLLGLCVVHWCESYQFKLQTWSWWFLLRVHLCDYLSQYSVASGHHWQRDSWRNWFTVLTKLLWIKICFGQRTIHDCSQDTDFLELFSGQALLTASFRAVLNSNVMHRAVFSVAIYILCDTINIEVIMDTPASGTTSMAVTPTISLRSLDS